MGIKPSDCSPMMRMDPEIRPPAASSDDPGVALLGSPDQLEKFRQRTELPSRIGRYVLIGLGALGIGAGSGIWLAYPSPTADGLLVFGLLLVILGFVQHRLLLRARDHWPVQAILWAEGLELVLSNGEIRAAPWSDPKFVLDVYARPVRHSGTDEYLMAWKMDSRVPLCPITEDGFDRVRQAAVEHELEFTEYRADNRRRTLRGYEIRPSPPRSTPPPLAGETAQVTP